MIAIINHEYKILYGVKHGLREIWNYLLSSNELNGLYELNGGEISLSALNQMDELSNGVIVPAFFDGEHLWIVYVTATLRELYTYDGERVELVKTPSNAFFQGAGRFFKDSKGRHWYSTNAQGIAIGETGQDDFQYFNQNNGLPSDFVISFLEDHEGNIWMGTQGNGIIKYSKSNFIANC